MNAKQVIKKAIDSSSGICMAYVGDLDDTDLLRRPAPGCNHINWQLGHLIAAEHMMIDKVAPGSIPPLPSGFAEKYTKETASKDEAGAFSSKVDLLRVHQEQRAATLAALEKLSDSDLDKPSGIEWCPTVGETFAGQGTHWLMHAGQWAVVRRQLGRPPLF
jgi:hypothetical protein